MIEAWDDLQSASFQILQANSDNLEVEPEFNPLESLSKATSIVKTALARIEQAKSEIRKSIT